MTGEDLSLFLYCFGLVAQVDLTVTALGWITRKLRELDRDE